MYTGIIEAAVVGTLPPKSGLDTPKTLEDGSNVERAPLLAKIIG